MARSMPGYSLLVYLLYFVLFHAVFAQGPAFPQPAFPQPAFPQPALRQPAFPQPAAPQPAFPQPAFPQPGALQPAFPQPAFPQPPAPQPAFPQPAAPQPAFPQPAFPQPAFPQPAAPQPAFPQPAAPQPATPQPAPAQPGGSGTPASGSGSTPSYEVVDTPSCPKNHDKVYVAPDGSWFRLQCDFHGWYAPATHIEAASYHECLNKCSEVEGCGAIVWDHLNGKTCSLMFGAGVVSKAGDTPCPNHDYAYLIDPPTAEQQDDMIILCSGQCPWAQGQHLPTAFGRVFRATCGMRHGTAYIAPPLTKETLKECVDACAAVLACHSVDYHERNRRCYLSNHQGEPTIPAAGFSSAYDVGCAGGCSGAGGGCCGGTNMNSGEPLIPYCPTRPGRIFEANGVRFRIICDMAYVSSTVKPIPGVKGPEECASLCADDSTCQGANWHFAQEYCSHHFVYSGQPPPTASPGFVTFRPLQERK
ncbi:hypothetical protein ASPCAL13722 [Aspergillus calidoustus]|uniref:Apple domain-containing protein n=1 Tax=Aspergillus calidoustus TaxID=454130 RepID=A0A0U5GHF6_ASPCI|nr:hypothetical protein ASPCAL13722 [Aspergillus calidoustus]